MQVFPNIIGSPIDMPIIRRRMKFLSLVSLMALIFFNPLLNVNYIFREELTYFLHLLMVQFNKDMCKQRCQNYFVENDCDPHGKYIKCRPGCDCNAHEKCRNNGEAYSHSSENIIITLIICKILSYSYFKGFLHVIHFELLFYS